MSFQIGPIHKWLFDQIKLLDERTNQILSFEGDWLARQVNSSQGKGLQGAALEDLITPPNIHNSLQELIVKADKREAAAVAGAKKDLSQLYGNHGSLIGMNAKGQIRELTNTAPGIFEVVQNVLLVGMPCDRVLSLVQQNEKEVVWGQSEILQAESWLSSGATVEKMFELRSHWLTGLVTTLNPKAKYRLIQLNPNGHPATQEAVVLSD